MARRRRRPPATQQKELEPVRTRCVACGGPLWVAYHSHRTVTTLDGVIRLRLQVRRCIRPACAQYHRPYRPEEELGWALPHGEFGLDIVALVGALRFREHRSVPEIHRDLQARGLVVAERTVTYLVQRYEELVAVRLSDLSEGSRLRDTLAAQQRVILAIDGLQPDVGHEVLWVVRDCLSGEILLARSLLSGCRADLAALLREVQTALAAVPAPIKKAVRGVRPIERALEAREVAAGPGGAGEVAAIRGYCLAVRSALTDDGRPPLAAAGLQLRDRLTAIHTSIEGVRNERQKRGTRGRSPVN